MQTNYQRHLDIALPGQVTDGDAKTRSYLLPLLPQITTIVLTDGDGDGDWVTTIVDDETGQTYTVTSAGDATEATAGASHEAAWLLSEANKIFTPDFDTLTLTLTAKHAGRSYTITSSGLGTTAIAVSNTQEAGGASLPVGRFAAQGSSDSTLALLASTTTVRDLVGVTKRHQAAGIVNLNDNSAAALDSYIRGSVIDCVQNGVVYMLAEDAVAPGDSVFLRLTQTSSAGSVGAVRATPAGSAQVNTIAPLADQTFYTATLRHKGVTYHASYTPTDATTAVADAIDGLYDSLVDAVGGATAALNGLGLTLTESDTLLTITTDAGVAIDDLVVNFSLDTEAATATVVIGTADVDALDISSVAKFLTSAAAGGLAKVQVHIA